MIHARAHAALVAGCAFLSLSVAASASFAADAFYKGKRLTIMINYAAGGPADIEGRLFAKHFIKHIEGQPNYIIQNIDGAGGVVGAKYLGEVAPKDGSILGALTGAAWLYVSNADKWPVSFRNYEFVARQASTTIHFVRTDVKPGMRVPADIVKAKGLVAGGLVADGSKDLRMRLGLDMLGVPFKYVTGYRSSATARIAVQRDEINFFSESPPTYRTGVVPQLVEPGLAIPVWWDEIVDPAPKSKQMEGLTIPTFLELYRETKGGAPSGELWDAYRTLYAMNSSLLRLLVLPPGAPRGAIEALSKAVAGLANDPDYEAESMSLLGYVPEYVTAPDMTQQVRAMMTVSPEMLDYIGKYTRNVPKL
jgi:tripartite-type tricarboxylate transporter receptor subunit TctC